MVLALWLSLAAAATARRLSIEYDPVPVRRSHEDLVEYVEGQWYNLPAGEGGGGSGRGSTCATLVVEYLLKRVKVFLEELQKGIWGKNAENADIKEDSMWNSGHG